MLLAPELLTASVGTPPTGPIWMLEADPAETLQLLVTDAFTVNGKAPADVPEQLPGGLPPLDHEMEVCPPAVEKKSW